MNEHFSAEAMEAFFFIFFLAFTCFSLSDVLLDVQLFFFRISYICHADPPCTFLGRGSSASVPLVFSWASLAVHSCSLYGFHIEYIGKGAASLTVENNKVSQSFF